MLTQANPTNFVTHIRTAQGTTVDLSAEAGAAINSGKVLVIDWINGVRTHTTTATSAVDRGAFMYVVVGDSASVSTYAMVRHGTDMSKQITSITAKPYSLFIEFPGGLPCHVMGMSDSGAPGGAQVYSEGGVDLVTPGPTITLTVTCQTTNITGSSAPILVSVGFHFEPTTLRTSSGSHS